MVYARTMYTNLTPDLALNEVMTKYPQLYKSSEIGKMSNSHRIILTPKSRAYIVSIADSTKMAEFRLKTNKKLIEELSLSQESERINKILEQNKKLERACLNGGTSLRIYGKQASVETIASCLIEESTHFETNRAPKAENTGFSSIYMQRFLDSIENSY